MIQINKYDQISINYPNGISHSLEREYYFDGFEEFINSNEHRFVKSCECSCNGKDDLELYLKKGPDNFIFFMAWVHFCNTLDLKCLTKYLPEAQAVTK